MFSKKTNLLNLNRDQIIEIQRLLDIKRDGIVGPITINSFNNWAREKYLDSENYIGPGSYSILKEDYLKNNIDISLIKKFEGFFNKAYRDPLGNLAIGFGTTVYSSGLKVKEKDFITQQDAEIELKEYIYDKILPTLESKIPYWFDMNKNQKNALFSFAYNVGENFYNSQEFRTISEVLRKKQWELVPKALLLYINPGSPAEYGLRRRRIEEGELFLK